MAETKVNSICLNCDARFETPGWTNQYMNVCVCSGCKEKVQDKKPRCDLEFDFQKYCRKREKSKRLQAIEAFEDYLEADAERRQFERHGMEA